MDEIWRKVPNVNGYEVSNLGRVRSSNGRSGGLHIIKPTYNRMRNYSYVSVQNGKSNRKNWILHRLVATVFIPNPDNLPAVDHVDGNKTNNSVANLEWVTYKENSRRAKSLGLVPDYDHSKAKKVTPEIAIAIHGDPRLNKVIAKEYGLGESTVTHIKLGTRWGNITSKLQKEG